MTNTPEGDQEIQAMAMVNTALSGLDSEAAARVLRWATGRYGVRATDVKVDNSSNDIGRDSDSAAGKAGAPQAIYVADLYAQAEPETDAERALVVGYWLQRHDGQENLAAQDINKELKHLGHGVSNVTMALGRLINQRPQLVIQVRKSGSSKQARKQYRLTAAGLARVEEMLCGTAVDQSQG